VADGYESAVQHFAEMPDISIDYAVAERSQSVRMVPLTCYWNDIGSWDAMYDILPKDSNGNALKGDCMTLDCKDSLIMGRDRLIAGIGIDDLLLVETDDVIVVAKKGESQKVKNVVERLKKQGRKEAIEHTTMYHAWGTSSVIGKGTGYRMKKVRLMPGKKLSMQMHYHRSEHWIVLRGTAEVTRGDEHMMVHESESVFIPQTTKHQLANPGRIPLEIIEVQNGSYIGEDDIERFYVGFCLFKTIFIFYRNELQIQNYGIDYKYADQPIHRPV
jgi:mannose-1-phosphate guanylyltransferase/mannose-6-phosphate isomerase